MRTIVFMSLTAQFRFELSKRFPDADSTALNEEFNFVRTLVIA